MWAAARGWGLHGKHVAVEHVTDHVTGTGTTTGTCIATATGTGTCAGTGTGIILAVVRQGGRLPCKGGGRLLRTAARRGGF